VILAEARLTQVGIFAPIAWVPMPLLHPPGSAIKWRQWRVHCMARLAKYRRDQTQGA
jgi:hypothetical protein